MFLSQSPSSSGSMELFGLGLLFHRPFREHFASSQTNRKWPPQTSLRVSRMSQSNGSVQHTQRRVRGGGGGGVESRGSVGARRARHLGLFGALGHPGAWAKAKGGRVPPGPWDGGAEHFGREGTSNRSGGAELGHLDRGSCHGKAFWRAAEVLILIGV